MVFFYQFTHFIQRQRRQNIRYAYDSLTSHFYTVWIEQISNRSEDLILNQMIRHQVIVACYVTKGPASFFHISDFFCQNNSMESVEDVFFDGLSHVEITVAGADIADHLQCQDVQRGALARQLWELSQ